MEIRLTLLRILVFLLLLASYWWLGGFDLSTTLPHFHPNQRAMFYRIILFVIGAGCVTVVEHEVGTLDRTNLRPLYLVLGTILMAAAIIWTRSLRVL
ncbi:MAG: hypothetical protein NTV08_12310 [Verrucomicrobia bacterium]|nr:hypothetical protein [Verrucomicrobiota bacterium]